MGRKRVKLSDEDRALGHFKERSPLRQWIEELLREEVLVDAVQIFLVYRSFLAALLDGKDDFKQVQVLFLRHSKTNLGIGLKLPERITEVRDLIQALVFLPGDLIQLKKIEKLCPIIDEIERGRAASRAIEADAS